jgi:hypothetical protein
MHVNLMIIRGALLEYLFLLGYILFLHLFNGDDGQCVRITCGSFRTHGGLLTHRTVYLVKFPSRVFGRRHNIM